MVGQEEGSNNYLWWMAIVFILLALSFIFDLWGDKREIIQHPVVETKHFTKETPREVMIEPVLKQDGELYRCNDCHQTITPSKVQKSFISAHFDVELDHGVNNYCTTCHHQEDREFLFDINKEKVSFTQSHKTCLQCHGPIYRDWENGVHGRIQESWDKDQRTLKRITCVACHDPHQPKFKSMEPSPAPKIKNYQNFLEGITVKDNPHES